MDHFDLPCDATATGRALPRADVSETSRHDAAGYLVRVRDGIVLATHDDLFAALDLARVECEARGVEVETVRVEDGVVLSRREPRPAETRRRRMQFGVDIDRMLGVMP